MKRKLPDHSSPKATKKPRVDGGNEANNTFKSELELGDFPSEVLEIVFSQIPLLDLLGTCSLVCSQWKEIIQSKHFLHWRKTYFRYKLEAELSPENDPTVIFNEAKDSFSASDWNARLAPLHEEPSAIWNICLPWLLEFVHNRYKYKNELFACVSNHSKYGPFRQLVAERWPHLGNAAMVFVLAVTGQDV